MERLIRILMFLALIFVAKPAFAGGACPSGANYVNPSNPTGSFVTLSTLGITSCYFIAANGADTNTGTDETHPFLHAPGMGNCGNNCSSGLLAPDIGIIFRGGDTWHFGNSGASPYAGTPPGCAANQVVPAGLCLDGINLSGTSSTPIYVGVDKTWFTGGSWARPIFTADNSPCNAATTGTMSDGATCTGTTDSYGQPSYYVSSCPYQVGSANNLVDVGFSKYVFLDNFEITGLCLSHVGQPDASDTYVRYGSAQAPLYFLNLYIHGSSHLQFAGINNGGAQCNSGTVCTNMWTFNGSVNNGTVGETIAFNVVDYSDSDPGGERICSGGFYNVAYNVFRYDTDCIPNPLHVFHDNLDEYFFEDGHSNLLEDIAEASGTNAIYNNVFRHIETYVSSGGGVGLWQAPPASTTDYIFNNAMYDVGQFEYINTGGTAGNNAPGTYTFFNNTFQSNASDPILRCQNDATRGPIYDTNNHYIDDGSPYLGASGQGSSCTGVTNTTAAIMTNSTATSDGYTSSQTYGYSPTSSGSPTVGVGTNETSGYCAALTTAASSDSTLSNAATACTSDTHYACTYVTATHSVSCPARTAIARPVSAAWDIGAYKSNGTQASGPNPPSNLTLVVH